MACATLKRSLDWDPLNSPTNSTNSAPNSGTKSTTTSHHHRPTKRRCLFLNQSHVSPPKQPSPFADIYHSKLTSDEIATNIKEEMKRLYNRKQLNFTSTTSNNNNQTTSSQLDLNTSNDFSASSSSYSNNVGLLSPSRRDQPLFTFRQVGLICEKLLKERESLIREEYEQVLTSKLAEQYDTFVKFTYDQIQKSFDVGATPSYLS